MNTFLLCPPLVADEVSWGGGIHGSQLTLAIIFVYISTTVRSWWSQWVVESWHLCYSWWRWWCGLTKLCAWHSQAYEHTHAVSYFLLVLLDLTEQFTFQMMLLLSFSLHDSLKYMLISPAKPGNIVDHHL